MTRFRALAPAAGLAAVLALAACDRVGAPASPPAPAAAPAGEATAATPNALTAALLESDGLTPANPNGGTARKLAFGEGEETVIAFLTVLNGGTRPTRSTNAECPAGEMAFADWGGGLTLAFEDGRFAGWSVGSEAPAGISTLKDIHVGSTLAELRAAWPAVQVEETTLGQEFTADGISGLLSGPGDAARVETLWTGASCVFR